MNAQQQLQLEDAQKKLSIFRKHLDLLARCTGESKNVDSTEVLSAVSELQSLVEWASLQPELGKESAVLLVKLQELHQIRENLEKTATNTNEYFDSAVNDSEEITQCETYSESIECIPNDVSTNLCDSNEENNVEDDSLSIDKDSLGELSASTEDPNLANAESPVSFEDGHVETIPIDDKTENTIAVDEIDKEDLTVLDTQEVIESSTCEGIPDEIEEMQEVSCESKAETDDLPSVVSEIRSPDLFRSEVIIIETDEEDKSSVWVDDSKSPNDPLDVCMYAIRNLYESLRLKENELLKLSTMQSDQKHIEALQAVIIDFHKDTTNLNNELEKSHKENMALKEQVLELEEAENDARLEAQKLEQKLIFLQEKDSHSQAEITQLKQSLKKSACTVAEKEGQEKELRSQLKYMETLVQQYEDQIKVMESKEANYKKKFENISEQENRYAKFPEKRKFHTKGTQTYDPRPVKVDANGNAVVSRNNSEANLNIVQRETTIEKNETDIADKVQAEDISTYLTSSTSDHESDASKEQEKDLLKRLHKLIDEDVSLQQQIHYVDEINLAMWKKLQNLDDHIGECKRQNINETNPITAEDDQKSSDCEPPEKEIQDTSTITTNLNIPEENLNSLDQSEKYIEERLAKLEEVNAAFEKELQVRENLCKEKERKCEEWSEIENRITSDLKRLAKEKEWIEDQIYKFNREKDTREKVIHELQEEINVSKEKYQVEISKVREDQQAITTPLNFKVNQMLITEKDILKMITNLKSEKNRSHGKSELEKLKCNYIELQLELSLVRDEIRRIEDQFKLRFDQWTSKYLLEETQKTMELERLRSENARNENIISNLETKQKALTEALNKQELYLEETKENYKKSLEKTDEKHLSVETELQNQLQQIEEETTVATSVLVEERKKVEKELQEDIQDLREKEEVYKTKIAELERDVIHLHDELHKIEAESKSEISDFQGDHEEEVEEVNEYEIEVPSSKGEDLSTASQSISVHDNLKPVEEITVKHVMEEEKVNNLEGNKIVEKVASEDNVDELRAQVRELQSDLEKISQETSEMPPVQPVKPITTSSLKQTVEDIDYAEVEECSFDAYKKNLQTVQNSTETSPTVKDAHKKNNPPSYKNNLKNQRVSSKQPVEENDYDEVLPRPTNFHVVQQVGPDTLLVGWTYVNPSVLDGFEVYLGNQVHERIYIPDRTKALISGLNLKKPTHLRLYALSRYGQMSEPAVLELPPLQDSNTQYFEDEEDEYRDFEDPTKRDHRPYSMEW